MTLAGTLATDVALPRFARRPDLPVPAVSLLAGAMLVVSLGFPLLLGPSANPSAGASPPRISATTGHAKVPAYWLVAKDGGIFGFGGAGFYGSTGSLALHAPVVGMAGTPDSAGYWLVASDGGVFTFGDAGFFGSMGTRPLNAQIVGMAPTADGLGYWLVASDGGMFAFGDAPFFGSMGGLPLNAPVVGIAQTSDARGYWLVASDGGIFAFGDAGFFGSMGGRPLNKPIDAISATPKGGGYTMVASDGGIFAFGSSNFFGSLGSVPLVRPIVAMAQIPSRNGYWFTDSNGAVSAFGSAEYFGSAPQIINQPVVGMAEATGNGSFGVGPYQSGSVGYDISKYQCTSLPPAPHTIGLVEANGWGLSAINPCLSTEAGWAGAGLNLYTFLSCTDAGTSAPTCTYTNGFAESQFAYAAAKAAGADATVAWWLDVEGQNWSHLSKPANVAVVQGAINGLKSEGINSAGIYASPGVWGTIVGTFQPAAPYWPADWQLNPATTCKNIHSHYTDLPAGPVELVQYSSPSATYPFGGMSTSYDDDYAC